MDLRPWEAIVVGSGATGGVAALTLAEAGVRVLVIEAGRSLSARDALGFEPLNSLRRFSALSSGRQQRQAQHPGYWKHNPQLFIDEQEHPYSSPADRPFLWTRADQVGGRSLTWGGITLRLSDADFQAAERDGVGSSWPIRHADLDPHYTALEQRLGVHGQRDGIAQVPDGWAQRALPSTAEEERFAAAVRDQLGYPWMPSRGFAAHPANARNRWPSSSSPGSTLQAALATGLVQLLSDHRVERFELNRHGDRAEAVIAIDRATGQRQRLAAERIVLCASTIQTLRVLLQSEEQAAEGRGFIDPSGRLGSALMDHVSICRFFAMPAATPEDQSALAATPAELSGAGSFFLPFGQQLPATSAALPLRGYGLWGGINRFDPPAWLKRQSECRLGFLIGHGEVLPDPANRVSLEGPLDRWGSPSVHINCRWRRNEEAMTRHMEQTITAAIAAAGGTMLPLVDLVKAPLIEPLLRQAVALQDGAAPPGYYIHEVGGAAMAANETEGVVDPWNRLWRCPNVLVVDGACWPSSAWQSPTLTMMAITRRACLAALRPGCV
mgnify:CR=1 FL=1